MDYRFCESVHASGRSPWHIRKPLPGEEPMFSGGIHTDSLCGYVRSRAGWDLRPEVTPERIAALQGIRGVCVFCIEHLQKDLL